MPCYLFTEDPVHKDVMKTRHCFMEDDSMDVKEATDAAVERPKFLLNRMFQPHRIPRQDEDVLFVLLCIMLRPSSDFLRHIHPDCMGAFVSGYQYMGPGMHFKKETQACGWTRLPNNTTLIIPRSRIYKTNGKRTRKWWRPSAISPARKPGPKPSLRESCKPNKNSNCKRRCCYKY